MKETRLGEFEEIILLLVGILGNEAYAFNLAEEFESQMNKATAIGAVHSTLSRLQDKGFLESEMTGATDKRGGRRKRVYTITASGQRALESAKDVRVKLWNQYPSMSLSKMNFSI